MREIPNLGRLTRVEPRAVWPDEAGYFTPWLAREENLALLSDTIGIDLEFEAQEKGVGPFRADILCKDTATDDWVLIENQLARTDHSHLGQLLTYAAGLKAVTIVWVANPFTEEHRAALDWLNEITDARFNFFGLEVELWQIGASPFAPKFNVVSKPNSWSRTVAEEAARVELTDAKRLQLEFWTAFKSFADQQALTIRTTKPFPQHWMNLALGRAGFGLSAIASLWNSEKEHFDSHEVRAEVQISDEASESYYSMLFELKDEIEAELGYSLTWHNPPNKKSKRMYVRRDAQLEDRSTWPELHRWLVDRLEELKKTFGPRVKALVLPEEGEVREDIPLMDPDEGGEGTAIHSVSRPG